MCFASTEPESILVIQVADVPHAVPNTVAIGNFVNRILIAPYNVLLGDHRTGDHQFANLAGWQFHGLLISAIGPSSISMTRHWTPSNRVPTQVPLPFAAAGPVSEMISRDSIEAIGRLRSPRRA